MRFFKPAFEAVAIARKIVVRMACGRACRLLLADMGCMETGVVNGIRPVVVALAGDRRAKRQRVPETWGAIRFAELAAASTTGACAPQFNG